MNSYLVPIQNQILWHLSISTVPFMSSKYCCLRVDKFSTVAFLLIYPILSNIYWAQCILNTMWPPLAASRLLLCHLTIPVAAAITMAVFPTPPASQREAMYA